MKKTNIKNLNSEISVEDKYDFVIIKLPNGDETLCRSTYFTNKIQGLEQDNISVDHKHGKIKFINVDVDYSQHLRHRRHEKKSNRNTAQQSKRKELLSKKFI